MSFNDPTTTPQPNQPQPPTYPANGYPANAYPAAPAPKKSGHRVAGIVLTIIGGLLTLSVLVSLGRPLPPGYAGNTALITTLVIFRLIPVALLILGIVLIVRSRRR
jgi:hypothetical protein